ncbi:epoxide hydrolase family protein [Variovorax boronicumulans]|uniref:epoxide hydrolase family protein n=1 Tax=Variovorax boronicumulans TaxID=436515 RepID=UPI001C57DF5E
MQAPSTRQRTLSIEPFAIAVADQRLSTVQQRVAEFDWSMLPDAGGWSSGVGLADLGRLVDHWRRRFDWRAQEARLNRMWPQYIADIGGQRLHFVHVRGNGSRSPVMLIHGWPSSFIEFEQVIAPLVADGHDVVVPSPPGFAFSGRPASPLGPRQIAEQFHQLMVALFGSRAYLVHGGDWGCAIGAWMAHAHPEAVAALHLSMVLVDAADAVPIGPEEVAWMDRRAGLAAEERGYTHQQSSRPQTLGIAMSDSPVGVAAWILEKFGAWLDVPLSADGSPNLWQVMSEDQLLTNIMCYVAPGSFVTSTWIYRGTVFEGSDKFPAGSRVRVPTGVAAFPDRVFPCRPRSFVQKSYDVVHWSTMARGGHFPGFEEPGLLVEDMRCFFAAQMS